MEITFWGVRGSIPAPGPATVRYGGNTSCVSVRLSQGGLVILDCGTGARNLGLALAAEAFGKGQGQATMLLSHAHWDHIQGFPFFIPLYVPGNTFSIFGGAKSPDLLEQFLEGQMAAQYFPVQTLRNMGASITMHAVQEHKPFDVSGAQISAHANPHGPTGALAFRIEDAGKTLVYASDAGYGTAGPSALTLAHYHAADLLIHDCTYSPEDRATHADRGLSSLDEAVDAAVRAKARRLALFHYDQDYSDHQVDQLLMRGRLALDKRGAENIEILGAAEGLTVTI